MPARSLVPRAAPKSTRPSLRLSSSAMSSATRSGCQSGSTTGAWPTRMREWRAARSADIRIGFGGAFR